MALVFSRSQGHYMTVPYNAVLAPTGALTLTAWVAPSALTMQRVVGRITSASTTTEIYGLDVYQNNCRFMIGTRTGTFSFTYSVQTIEGGTVPPGVWTHIAGVWNGSNMFAYVNGVQVATAARTAALITSSTPLVIGADFNGSTASEHMDGALEDVRLYSRALTANEIQSIYTVGGTDLITNGLALHMKFDDGAFGSTLAAGATIRGYSRNGLVATNVVAGTQYIEKVTKSRRTL